MDRIIGLDHYVPRCREVSRRAQTLLHRRAAAERCSRTGLLRRCAPVPRAADVRCCAA